MYTFFCTGFLQKESVKYFLLKNLYKYLHGTKLCTYICTMGNEVSNITWAEYAQATGKKVDTVRINLYRKGVKLTSEQMRGIANPEHIALLGVRNNTPKPEATPEAKPRTAPPLPPKPEKRTAKYKKFIDRGFLLNAINTGEMLFVLYGSFVLFGVAGLIPGGLVIAFYTHSVLEMHEKGNNFAKDVAMFVCALLGLVFTWLHGQTFFYIFQRAEDLRYPVACASAWITSAISFFALWQTRNTKG